VTIEHLRWLIANPGIFVWDEDDRIAGFSVAAYNVSGTRAETFYLCLH
jgi:hypothetical protein